MKHVHHDMIVEWAADPSRVIEVRGVEGTWSKTTAPSWATHIEYRFKPAEPKYIVVNGVNVPEPVRGGLKEDQRIWLAIIGSGLPVIEQWSEFYHEGFLSLGLVHLTKEAAQTHIDAMLLPSRTDK